jgi:hypothetical protein
MPAELPYHRLKVGWLVGVALAFAIFAVVATYSARMTYDYPDYNQDRAVARYATLAKVRHDEDALLTPVNDQGKPTAAWADQDKGLIKIPIDEAMAHELTDLKNQPAVQGAEIPGAAPAPAPAAAPSTNAAPAAPTPAGKPAAAKAKTTPPAAPDSAKKKPAPPAANKETH